MLQYPSRFIQIVACQMVIQLIMRRVFLPALSWPNSLLGWNIFQCENWARLEWKCTTAVVKIGLLGSNPPPQKKDTNISSGSSMENFNTGSSVLLRNTYNEKV